MLRDLEGRQPVVFQGSAGQQINNIDITGVGVATGHVAVRRLAAVLTADVPHDVRAKADPPLI